MIKEVKQEEFFNLARSRKWNQHEIHENPFLKHTQECSRYLRHFVSGAQNVDVIIRTPPLILFYALIGLMQSAV
jgi:hypothetical protein